MDYMRIYKLNANEFERVARELLTSNPADSAEIDELYFSLNYIRECADCMQECLDKLTEEKGE